MKLILARDYAEAEQFAYWQCFRVWVFLNDPDYLHVGSPPTVYLVGRYWESPHYGEILDAMEHVGARKILVN